MCKKTIFILLIVSGCSPFIYAASFDCSKAGTDEESWDCSGKNLRPANMPPLVAADNDPIFMVKEKAEGKKVNFVELSGEIYARYQAEDGKFSQYSLDRDELIKIDNKKDYPIATFMKPRWGVRIENDYILKVKNFDNRERSRCPKEFNRYLVVDDGKGTPLSDELVFLYKMKKPIIGGLEGCPNAVGSKIYRTSYAAIGEGIIEDKLKSRNLLVNSPVSILSGVFLDIYFDDTPPDSTVGSEYDMRIPPIIGSLRVKNYCEMENIYMISGSLVRSMFAGDEINYQNEIDIIEKKIEKEKEDFCR